MVSTTAPVVPPSLPISTNDQFRTFVHSFIAEFLSQLGQLGTNRSLSAPPAVPDLALLIWGGGGGARCGYSHRGAADVPRGFFPL